MGILIVGIVLLVIAVVIRASGKSLGSGGRRAAGTVLTLVSGGLIVIGAATLLSTFIKVIDAGTVGVQHAFGTVSDKPLLPGVHFVPPWSEIERYSTREEQFPGAQEEAEVMQALS